MYAAAPQQDKRLPTPSIIPDKTEDGRRIHKGRPPPPGAPPACPYPFDEVKVYPYRRRGGAVRVEIVGRGSPVTNVLVQFGEPGQSVRPVSARERKRRASANLVAHFRVTLREPAARTILARFDVEHPTHPTAVKLRAVLAPSDEAPPSTDPTTDRRRLILDTIRATGETRCRQLAGATGIPLKSVHRHLMALRKAGEVPEMAYPRAATHPNDGAISEPRGGGVEGRKTPPGDRANGTTSTLGENGVPTRATHPNDGASSGVAADPAYKGSRDFTKTSTSPIPQLPLPLSMTGSRVLPLASPGYDEQGVDIHHPQPTLGHEL